MKGFLFRLGSKMKDFGERHPWSGFVKTIGMRLRDWVLRHSTVGDLM
jgi:hypothetical protein